MVWTMAMLYTSLYAFGCWFICSGFILAGLCTEVWGAESPTFFRGLNLNGPPVTIDGHAWDGQKAAWYRCHDKAFENQHVQLLAETDADRARMIRSSRWGGNRVDILDVPAGSYTVFLYVWEDNNREIYTISLNGREVVRDYQSGPAGHWERLGPWPVRVNQGMIQLTSRGGAANFSGIEIWRGNQTGHQQTKLTPDNIAFFESRIRPLLIKHCYECHSVDSETVEGGLQVDSRAALKKGGGSGPVIKPGNPSQSLLIKAVRYEDQELAMPPAGKLSSTEIADLEKWVRMGAPDPRDAQTLHLRLQRSLAKGIWSLKPVSRPDVPDVHAAAWPMNDLDRFILAKMEMHQLAPAVPAKKQALIRRVTYDLIGLPPTPEEIDAFLADNSPDAFRSVVDRLLNSPHYGERWGRHWLDVVRYADTAGDNSDFPVPQIYRYRNWVIDALNRDLPYDQFVKDQIAGDLRGGDTVQETRQRLIATGYLANSRRFGSRVDDYPWHLTIEDTLDNLGRTFLATTLNCARCHDHKFDPITQEDYYALYGIFNSTRYPWPGIELEQRQRDLVPLVSPEELELARAARHQEQAKLETEVKRLDQERKVAQGDQRKDLEQKWKEAQNRARQLSQAPLPVEQAYAVAEARQIGDCAIQIKGDPARLGNLVPRRFPIMLGGMAVPDDDPTSGRLALAGWIADPANPLTARVMVNRIWLYHFGKGLVPTPNDFGRQGKPPTHPELLDWLATRLIESGWSVKEMHRIILLSRTYQLSSIADPIALEKDPENRWLASFPRRRLDADAIRDTLLMLSGNLDTTIGGPHPFPPQSQWKFTQHHPFKAVYDTNRRSVYLMTQRIQRHPYLAIFDGADPSASTPQRLTSTTPLQALYLLNDPFVHEQAQGFARRLINTEADSAMRLRKAYRMALGRIPSADEQSASRQLLEHVHTALQQAQIPTDQLEQQCWQSLCRTLFRLNEFVYID